MALLAELGKKSWLTPDSKDKQALSSLEALEGARKTALLFLLAVITVLFFLFSITYVSRSQYPDFQGLAAEPWMPLAQSWRLWLNTAFLVLASSGLELAKRVNLPAQYGKLFLLWGGVILCSLAFIVGQLALWQLLKQQGFLIASNPANSYFYLLTGIHGLHLLAGILVLGRGLYLLSRQASTETIRQSLQLCAWYWHYLLLLWLYLFALLSAPAEAYNTIAAWCGL
ncbi:cytochrome c oxidase subunit 3 [Shewanella sedimentimangrovi]|uniref:Cytochrome c oxidase subunit 3 n=1 Tax=Shewanella sedimentimangrovi TaxID=2814293 RepID=A0ABX7R4X9_9GAMM|nr:cytochrome c oxidase subunit 3 [Shewanella sedimentimangrovi]QSX38897.1 cytochrome c oxidase subunit 3 [Shewanella sedimentimangrovi]